MTVRHRELDAATAWRLLCGVRGLEEPDEPISVPTAQLQAQWEVFGDELLMYWDHALDLGADPGWPDPQRPGKCWAQLVLEEGVDDDEARRRIDALMDWPPADAPGTNDDGTDVGTPGGDD
jgi:hypothetical protein